MWLVERDTDLDQDQIVFEFNKLKEQGGAAAAGIMQGQQGHGQGQQSGRGEEHINIETLNK